VSLDTAPRRKGQKGSSLLKEKGSSLFINGLITQALLKTINMTPCPMPEKSVGGI